LFGRERGTLIVRSVGRLARNLDDRRLTVQSLTSRGVRVQFVKEGLVFAGGDSPMASLLLSVLRTVAEFERSSIGERRREGIALGKGKEAHKGRQLVSTDARRPLI
jgi:DNA invertase Pin-like site-specific DNA recombinase